MHSYMLLALKKTLKQMESCVRKKWCSCFSYIQLASLQCTISPLANLALSIFPAITANTEMITFIIIKVTLGG